MLLNTYPTLDLHVMLIGDLWTKNVGVVRNGELEDWHALQIVWFQLGKSYLKIVVM